MTDYKLYMENLDEYVNDENKIVTYKWLSRTLQIHVNLAKRLLFMFLDEQRNKQDNELSVTYFVAGSQLDPNGNKSHVCCVVPETDLSNIKNKLTTLTSCHIYSLHKVKLKDSNALYTIDYESTKEDIHKSTSFSAIKYASAQPRSSEELSSITKSSPVKVKSPDKIKKETTPTTNMTNIKKKPEAKGSIASMFTSGNKKPKTETNNNCTDENKKGEKETTKPQEKITKKTEGVKSFFKTTDKDVNKIKTEQKSPVESKSPKRHGKKKADSDLEDTRKNKSKRRRIKDDIFDSSSSEEEIEVMDEDPIPPTPPPASNPVPSPTKSPSPVKTKPPSPVKDIVSSNGQKRRKRVKKLVAKTYKDEDGFMITEKVYETDSTDASEKEEDPIPLKQTNDNTSKQNPTAHKKKSPASKKASPVKGKQTSLTSFFKKK